MHWTQIKRRLFQFRRSWVVLDFRAKGLPSVDKMRKAEHAAGLVGVRASFA